MKGLLFILLVFILHSSLFTLAHAYKLPDTGQTKCYQAVEPWAEIPCTGTGQDGAYSINPMSYTDYGKGMVRDNNTGLIWQKCSVGQNNDASCSGTASMYNWCQASGTYDATYNSSSRSVCGDLSLGGYTDWRLPTKKELMSIVDYSIPWPGPTIVGAYYPNTPNSSSYWSSTTYAIYPYFAWIVGFEDGYSGYSAKYINAGYVRCVRGGQPKVEAANLADNGNGTVTDANTGLVWQQREPGYMTWGNALSYCEGLSLGGHSDWRLPNVKELESLTNDTRYNPSIDTSFFPNASSSGYWSSTTDAAYYPGSAWGVHFEDGNNYCYKDSKYDSAHVRCVRGGQSGSLGSFDHLDVTYGEGGPIWDKTVGQQFPIRITAIKADGSVNTGVNGYIDLSAPGGIYPANPVLMQNGTVTVSVRLYQNGTQITISAGGLGLSGQSNPFNVTGGPAAPGKISGHVVDSTGTAIYGATVILSREYGGPSVYLDEKTTTSGFFVFTGVDPGVYYIRAEKDNKSDDTCNRIDLAPGGYSTVEMKITLFESTEIPVVLVPGFPGSTHKSLNGWWHWSGYIPQFKNETYEKAEDLILHDPDRAAGWRDLIDDLKNKIHVKDIVECPWDWRMPLDQAADKYLADCIDKARKKSPNGKVNVIAHSMGGLLVRTYIQKRDCADTILNFSMAGTPHLGSTNAYFLWEGGNPLGLDNIVSWGTLWGNFYWNTTEALYEDTYHNHTLWSSEKAEIQRFYQDKTLSLRELMPTYGFLRQNGAGSLREITTDVNVNTTLNKLNKDSQKSACMGDEKSSGKVVTRVYWNNSHKTLTDLNVSPPSGWRLLSPLYLDGWPEDPKTETSAGDGTVPTISSYYPCDDGWATCTWTSGEHSELIKTARSDIIRDMYPGATTTSVKSMSALAAAETAKPPTLQISYRGRVLPQVIDPTGKIVGIDFSTGDLVTDQVDSSVNLDNGIGSIFIAAPVDGTYTLTMKSYYPGEFSVRIAYGDDTQVITRKFLAYNNAGTVTHSFLVTAAIPEKVTLVDAPPKPTSVQADAYDSGGLKTRLTWAVSTDPLITGYNIYSREVDEPYLNWTGTSTSASFDTTDAWAADSSVKVRMYTVAAITADGTESFLSDLVKNDDRDHDGLTDVEELALGTDPTKADTDGDGFSDSLEAQRGSNPLDKDSMPTVLLTVRPAGTGGGTVGFDPSGLVCTFPSASGVCFGDFSLVSTVKLTATPDKDSLFVGWSGACTGAGPCSPVMSGPQEVTATFDIVKPAKVGSTLYDTLTDAYGDSAAGTILAREYLFAEDLTLGTVKAVTIKGGYEAAYNARPGFTIINGKLTIGKGSLIVDRVSIR